MIHAVNTLLALGLTAGSLAAWPALPESIPVHFDLGGTPDRWARTSLLSWFGLPAAGVALAAALYLLGRWIPTRPEWLNLPQKDRYLALSPEERRPVNEALGSILHWTACLVLVLFSLIQALVFRRAVGLGSGGLDVALLVVSFGSGPFLAAAGLLRVQRAVDRAWTRHRAHGGS